MPRENRSRQTASVGNRPFEPRTDGPNFVLACGYHHVTLRAPNFDPIVQWPRTPPFHGGNTGSNPVRVANYLSCFFKRTYDQTLRRNSGKYLQKCLQIRLGPPLVANIRQKEKNDASASTARKCTSSKSCSGKRPDQRTRLALAHGVGS